MPVSFVNLILLCLVATLAHAQNNYQQQNQLALDAQMHYDLNSAKSYYQKAAKLKLDSTNQFAEEKLEAIKGLRDIAMLEQEFAQALALHKTYIELIEKSNPNLALHQKLQNAKIEAICLQETGDSQAALKLLSNYAFGDQGYLDKEMVDYLAKLLLSKYPKRALRKMLPKVQDYIYMEDGENGIRFYLAFFEDKIYFPQAREQFAAQLKAGQTIPEQAIAYYQRKLCNSYFYQKLMQEL